MKEDPARGVTGAVVLEQRMVFTGKDIRHVLRIRVLSEQGKAAVEFRHFLPESGAFEGRTVQRDGTVVAFDTLKDFNQKTTSDGNSDREVKVLMPPGVTADCVVELRYVDRAAGGVEHPIPASLRKSASWRFPSPFLIRELTVEFWPSFPWSVHIAWKIAEEPTVLKEGRHYTYTFRNLPGEPAFPYALGPLSGRPTVRVWQQPPFLQSASHAEVADFWKTAVSLWLKPTYHDGLKKGKVYAALSADLARDLPTEPAKAAEQLYLRLDRRILNQSWPTLEEAGRFKKKEGFDRIDAFDLEEAAVQGRTSGLGMTLLFASLLEDHGLHPKYGFVQNRNLGFMNYQMKDVHQLTNLIIGVALGPGRTLWFDPSLRFAAPGLIQPAFQGVDALVLDGSTWELKPERVPSQPASFNHSFYLFRLAFAEGEERVELKAGFSGFPELVERHRYLALSQTEADRTLKERMEKAIKDATVTRAVVLDALNPDKNVQFEVEAKLDLPGGTLTLDPFPGLPAPLWLPSVWPEPRTVPIAMDYLRNHGAVCDFTVPPGYALLPVPALDKENGFGRVTFRVSQKQEGTATQVQVRFQTQLLSPATPASAERELREYLGWVKEAYHTKLILERP